MFIHKSHSFSSLDFIRIWFYRLIQCKVMPFYFGADADDDNPTNWTEKKAQQNDRIRKIPTHIKMHENKFKWQQHMPKDRQQYRKINAKFQTNYFHLITSNLVMVYPFTLFFKKKKLIYFRILDICHADIFSSIFFRSKSWSKKKEQNGFGIALSVCILSVVSVQWHFFSWVLSLMEVKTFFFEKKA